MRSLPCSSPTNSALAVRSRSLRATHGIAASSIPYQALGLSQISKACASSRLIMLKSSLGVGSAPVGNRHCAFWLKPRRQHVLCYWILTTALWACDGR